QAHHILRKRRSGTVGNGRLAGSGSGRGFSTFGFAGSNSALASAASFACALRIIARSSLLTKSWPSDTVAVAISFGTVKGRRAIAILVLVCSSVLGSRILASKYSIGERLGSIGSTLLSLGSISSHHVIVHTTSFLTYKCHEASSDP